MLREFKAALEKELGCSVTIEINVFSSDLRSNEEANDVAQKLEEMICEIETDVQTEVYSGDSHQWFDVRSKALGVRNKAVIFLPYPDSVKQAN